MATVFGQSCVMQPHVLHVLVTSLLCAKCRVHYLPIAYCNINGPGWYPALDIERETRSIEKHSTPSSVIEILLFQLSAIRYSNAFK
jgi:hypothetical protein